MIIEKITHRFFNLILNDTLLDWCIHIHSKYIKPKIDKAEGRYITKNIQNKGIDARVKWGSVIYYSENLRLGNHVRIGEGAFLFCKGGITIGDNTQISRNVLIYSSNHDVNGGAIPYNDQYVNKAVIIGKSVWIGMNVVITPGIKIGDGAIIGMGTVISKDVPAGAVVVGAQQRIVKQRDMKKFRPLEEENILFGLLWPEL